MCYVIVRLMTVDPLFIICLMMLNGNTSEMNSGKSYVTDLKRDVCYLGIWKQNSVTMKR